MLTYHHGMHITLMQDCRHYTPEQPAPLAKHTKSRITVFWMQETLGNASISM